MLSCSYENQKNYQKVVYHYFGGMVLFYPSRGVVCMNTYIYIYIYYVNIMYILCIYYVYIMYILCIYYVYIMYILCIYYVYIMYILCIYYVYIMYILCIYYVYINIHNTIHVHPSCAGHRTITPALTLIVDLSLTVARWYWEWVKVKGSATRRFCENFEY